jgi:endonuclease/exonuclease/phosphatase family metal-dependent hydrolase
MRRTLSITTLSLLLLSLCLNAPAFAQVVPAKGSGSTLDIASWNIEWFGDTANGPTNESLQLQNARAVIAGADMDIWGVAEIVSLAQWNSLKAQLPGYAGFIAKEPNVINGAAFYSGFSNTEQNVGILYKTSVATVTDARVILTANDFDFSGRPPLQVTLRVMINGRIENVVVIILHAKCCSDSASWTRRRNAANALKSYLDANFPTQKVWVIGDFNDDVDASITPGSPSPYANFVNDAARYRFPTKAL